MSPTHVRQKQIYVVVRRAPRKHHGTVHRLSYSKPYFFCNVRNVRNIKDRPAIDVSYLIAANGLT